MNDREGWTIKINGLVRFYPVFIVMGVVFFVLSLWVFDGWRKITGALWVALVLLWTQQYRRYRASARR